MDEQPAPQDAPPVGEEIHLPGSTPIPVLVAVGITLVITGLTISVWFIVAGAIILVALVPRWIRDTRRDIDELPLEH